jgi:hypothetical protein
MQFCGNGSWCCCYNSFGKSCDRNDCCSRNFTLARGLGTVVRQFDNADTSPSGSNNNNNGNEGNQACQSGFRGGPGGGNCNGWNGDWRMRLIPVIVAGLTGSLLLAMTVAFGFSCTQNRRLKRQVETLEGLNANLKSFSTISARPSVSAQHMTFYPDETVSPSETYQVMRTSSGYHHSMHQPPTPSSVTAGPGYGFPVVAGRRPSLPRTIGHPDSAISDGSMHNGMRTTISELPAEKEIR